MIPSANLLLYYPLYHWINETVLTIGICPFCEIICVSKLEEGSSTIYRVLSQALSSWVEFYLVHTSKSHIRLIKNLHI